jgi:hypothetical protein
MTRRWLVALAGAAALLMGCESASPRWSAARTTAPDPDRWERAACRLQQYPPELDARAFARARLLDVEARRQGTPGTSATEQLVREREVFEARCATWRAASAAPASTGEDPARRAREGWTSL